MAAWSLYVHIPFCQTRCSYCDFNASAGLEALIPLYVKSLINEIHFSAEAIRELSESDQPGPDPLISTVYFGGGTPSLLPTDLLAEILTNIRQHLGVHPNAEISLEANPGTLTRNSIIAMRKMGINRLSLGMQSAHAPELSLLGRRHQFTDVQLAASWARQAGFENINLDLIFGLPGQTLEAWQRSLTNALALQPEHLSLYALTLEADTPLGRKVQQGDMPEPDPDLAADMYDYASDELDKIGYEQYEISNWAKRSPSGEIMSCRHNLQYWRCQPCLGFGAGAHAFVFGMRTENVNSPLEYIRRMSITGKQAFAKFPCTPAVTTSRLISPQESMGEVMMMGLRLTREGILDKDFQQRFGQTLQETYPLEIEELYDLGLLEWDGNRLRLSKQGRLLGNQVFIRFI